MIHTPPYVSLIQSGKIQLYSLDRATVKKMRQSGLNPGWVWFGNGDLAYPEPDDFSHPPELIAILKRLAETGVCFSEVYKQQCSPADLMRELREAGQLKIEFNSISWKGPGQWQLHPHPSE